MMQLWVWKLKTSTDLMWLQFLVSWVPEGEPH